MPGQNLRGFAERVALVVGGARGVGRAAALQLALEGAYVITSYAPGDAEGEGVAGELRDLGTLAQAVAADPARGEDVRRLFEAVGDLFGRLDLLINAAGVSVPGSLGSSTEDDWRRVIDSSVKAVLLSAQAAAPLLLRRPSPAIVNVASEAGLNGRGPNPHYVAAQAGVVGLTKALARELAPRVRVNCVAVGGAPFDRIRARNTAADDFMPKAEETTGAAAGAPAGGRRQRTRAGRAFQPGLCSGARQPPTRSRAQLFTCSPRRRAPSRARCSSWAVRVSSRPLVPAEARLL